MKQSFKVQLHEGRFVEIDMPAELVEFEGVSLSARYCKPNKKGKAGYMLSVRVAGEPLELAIGNGVFRTKKGQTAQEALVDSIMGRAEIISEVASAAALIYLFAQSIEEGQNEEDMEGLCEDCRNELEAKLENGDGETYHNCIMDIIAREIAEGDD